MQGDVPTQGSVSTNECRNVEFEIFSCPRADHHANYRFTSWCEPSGITASQCPECRTPGMNAQLHVRYGSTNPSVPWASYRVLYQTRP